ncbi:MAG: TonB-dependent receptor [Rubrivivax sp.]|nr:TonB-dependent receptor [Rubrivivax sp.]
MRTRRTFLPTLLALAASQAMAQSAPAAPPSQSIEVTARRVTERIIDVPLSVSAISGTEITERGLSSLTDLTTFTPGLLYAPDFGRTQERPVIRGISALRPEAPQPVSVFVDGLFVRDGVMALALDDAQRVEVIKGPQSALYGRATYAGAINYVSVKPGNVLGGTAIVSLGQAGELSGFGAVTVPLVKDRLSMRVRAKFQQFGGQYTNTQTGNKIGTEDTTSMGLQMLYTPSPTFSASLSLNHSEENDGLFNATVRSIPTQAGGVVTSQNNSTNVANGSVCNGRTINIVGNNAVTGLPDANVAAAAATRLNGWPCGAANFSGTRVTRNELDLANYTDPTTGINYGNIAGNRRTIDRGGLTLTWELPRGMSLVSQTGYTRQSSELGADQSYNATRFSIAGASWLSYDRDKLQYLSQEFRLNSDDQGAWQWMLGVFFYDEEGSGFTGNGVIRRVGTAVLPASLSAKSGSKVTNSSPFGRVQFQISPQMRVSLEGRFNRETVEVVGTPLGVATVNSGTCVAGQPCIVSGSRTFTDFSPRLTLDYKPSRDALIYVQAAAGSKSGGFNTTPGLPAANFAYDGETVKSAELGYKLQLGAAAVNVAVFRNDIDNLQLSNISTVVSPFTGAASTTTIVNNVGKARTQGLELDLSVRATDWLRLAAIYAFTDAKAIEGTEITNGTVFGGNMSVAGFTLPRTPRQSATLSASVDMPMGAGGLRFTSRADVSYLSRRYAEIQNMIWADPVTRINLSAGLKGKGWSANLWVKNAANDDTSMNGFRYLDPVTFRRTAVDFLPRLRQVGVTGRFDF